MSPSELFQKLKDVPMNNFGGLFMNMRSSAFRLEALDFYTIPGEEEDLERFKRGEEAPRDTNATWVETIRAAVSRGIDFRRVRLVRRPVNDYVKFETEWGYKFNVAAGEQTSILFYEDKITFTSDVPVLKDFWLFDDERCFLMEYDLGGRFLGVREVPAEAVPAYALLKQECLQRAIDIRSTPLWDGLWIA